MTIPPRRRSGSDPRARAARDVDDELAFHREQTVAELVAQGMTAAEAERAAARRFGSAGVYRRRLIRLSAQRLAQDRRRATMHVFVTAARSVARGVLRSPGFAFGVIAILTLGLGVNAITFSLVDRLILRGPAGVMEPEMLRRVVAIRPLATGATHTATELAYLDYRDALQAGQLAGAAAESRSPLLFGSGAGAEIIQARFVTATYFPLLAVSPALGRFFTADESERDGARLVVLSHAFWQRRFSADPAVVGQTLHLESHRYTVIGVAPRHFTGSSVGKVDVFLPLEAAADEQVSGPWRTSRGFMWISVLVRLAPGASNEAAEAELSAAYRHNRESAARGGPPPRVELESLNAVRGAAAADDVGVAALLWGVALLVLAIAAANVANLFLARSLRTREHVAIRLALGASRARMVAEQASEGAILALVGGAFAVLAASVGVPIVQQLLFPHVDWLDTAVNLRALLFVAACAVTGGSVAAAVPAWRAGRTDVVNGLRMAGMRTSRRRTRTQAAMLVLQAALSVVLLVGAGLFIRSLDAATSFDLGLETDRVMAVSTFHGDTPPRPDFTDALRSRVDRIPGVERTTLVAGTIPFVSSWSVRLAVRGLAERPTVEDGGPYIHAVEPGYFEAVGTAIVQGRSLTAEDRAGAPRVAVVNRTMARLYWPGGSPLGKCLLIGKEESRCSTVVGVAENTRRQAIVEGDSLLFYIPLEQAPNDLRSSPRLVVRSGSSDAGTNARIAESIRREALALEPGLRMVRARTLDEAISPQLRAWRLGAALFSAYGALALLVAAVGLYSVVAFDVEGRRREIGVRAALGASSTAIVRLVVADGLRLATAGVVAGLALAWLLAPSISALLYGVPPQDSGVFAAVAALLLSAALLASALPALRASRIDPSRTLRSE